MECLAALFVIFVISAVLDGIAQSGKQEKSR
jgi:hypothetical protein